MSQAASRIRTSIDRDWRFVMTDVPGGQAEEYDDSSWAAVRVPHDWTVDCLPDRVHFVPQFRVAGHLEWMSDSFLPKTIGWYRRHLTLPEAWRQRRIYLEFEGVFRNCTVWVNGRQAGQHLWGYPGFVLDITPLVRFGDAGNVLAVRVDSTECEGWWCEGSGIYRHVWLQAVEPLHVEPWGTFLATPQVSEARAAVAASTTVRNAGPGEARAVLQTTILDAAGAAVAAGRCDIAVPAGGVGQFRQELAVDSPRLWSPQEPNLYRAVTAIHADGRTVDDCQTTFGIRWYEFTADRGFFLNGLRLQIRGANIHHDFGGLGTALPDRANGKTVEVLKEMGCNALRPGHIAAAPALMDACDRLGMLLFAETRYLPLAGPEETTPPLLEMIRRDRNHPCILLWTLGNTGGEPHGCRHMTDRLQALHDAARRADPTRPTSVALEGNADANENGFAMVTDLVGYNGGGMNGKDDLDHQRYPQRRIHISEYAGRLGARGVYRHSATEYRTPYISSAGKAYKMRGNYFDQYNLCKGHEAHWAHISERPWLPGGLMWAGIEYRGEAAGWPTVNSQYGPFDICRFRKDLYYYYKQEWCNEPMVHAFPHWTWPGREGQTINVWCYSNCDEVELSLNGTSLGRKPAQRLEHLEWSVPYEPGVLSARGIKGGHVLCRQDIPTAGLPVALRAEADRTTLAADACDLSFVTLSVHDGHGVFVPTADNFIKVTVEGRGRLLGMCSGDPRSHELARSPVMRAFNGLLLATVQSDEQPGPITLIARSSELHEARVELAAQ